MISESLFGLKDSQCRQATEREGLMHKEDIRRVLELHPDLSDFGLGPLDGSRDSTAGQRMQRLYAWQHVSNGALIVAALHKGLRSERVVGSPSMRVNTAERPLMSTT